MSINGNLNISVTINVLEHFLKEKEAALHASQDGVGNLAGLVLLEFLLYVS